MCVPCIRTIAGPHALEQIETFLASLWHAHTHVPDMIRMRLGIAVGEIAANIINHATAGLERPVHVEVSANVRPDDVLIRFTDDGIPVPDDLTATEMPHELAESGRGLALARAVLRHLMYERAGETNHWTLVSERF